MLHFWIQYPSYYLIPFAVTLAVLVSIVKFTPRRWYKGEAVIFREPFIVLCCSLLWFLFWVGVVVGGALWLMTSLIRFLIQGKE